MVDRMYKRPLRPYLCGEVERTASVFFYYLRALTRADLIPYGKFSMEKLPIGITTQSMFAHPQTDTRVHPLKIMVMHTNTNIHQQFFSQMCLSLEQLACGGCFCHRPPVFQERLSRCYSRQPCRLCMPGL